MRRVWYESNVRGGAAAHVLFVLCTRRGGCGKNMYVMVKKCTVSSFIILNINNHPATVRDWYSLLFLGYNLVGFWENEM